MKYAKILVLAAMALAVMMAFAGNASATELTCESGAKTACTPTIHAISEGATELVSELGAFGTIKCPESTVEGTVTSHGPSVTAEGAITTLTFGGPCTGGTPTSPVAKPGKLIVHTDSPEKVDGNGTLTSSEAVVVVHNTAVGTCTFETPASGTDIGTVTGSRNNGGKTAFLTINGVVIRVGGTNPFCGSTSTWKGKYTVTTPMYLDID